MQHHTSNLLLASLDDRTKKNLHNKQVIIIVITSDIIQRGASRGDSTYDGKYGSKVQLEISL